MKQANGFTLVELLVAMVAGSLLLVSLSWMLGSVTHILKASPKDETIAQVGELAPVLTRLIEQIPPPDKDVAAASIGADGASFVSQPPQALGADGMMTVTLKAEQQADGLGLVGEFEGQRQGRPWQRRDILAHGFSAIDFDARWPDAPGAPKLPSLVTIRFATREGETARIVATPRLTGGGPCHFDPISMTCRR